jgi:hypothetical protein
MKQPYVNTATQLPSRHRKSSIVQHHHSQPSVALLQ